MKRIVCCVLALMMVVLVGCADGAGTTSTGDSPEVKLHEIREHMRVDMWNEGFSDISNYIMRGTDSTGETLDIDFSMQRLNTAYEKLAEYNEYLASLESEEYNELKYIWEKIYGETGVLYNKLQAEYPVAGELGTPTNYDFDTSLFTQYLKAFIDEIDKITTD